MFLYSPSTQGFYKEDIHPVEVIPDDVFEVSEEEHKDLFSAMNAGKGSLVCRGNKLYVEHVEAPLNIEALRSKRNKKLRNTDWTQLPDVPEETRKKWAEYRQTLRDLPKIYENSIDELVWPQEPN